LRLLAAFHPFLALAVLAAACCFPTPLPASPAADAAIPAEAASPAEPADEDDVWVVSTRRLPDIGCVPTNVTFGVERLVGDAGACRWRPSDLPSLLAEPHRPLLIFIHGNRYDAGSAKSQGLLLARCSKTCRPDGPPIRTVIFSWPSSQEGLLLRDSRSKYERAMTEGHYLAWLLGRVPPEQPVAIVSYSYGGLIALEALDHLVGAERSGRADLQPWIDRPARFHLVLVASAVRHDALAPCGEYRRVLRCIDRLTLLNNTEDQALRFFKFIDPNLRTEALGHENMPARWLPPEIEFVQIDAAPIIGKSHRFPPYLESPSLRQRLATGALDGLSAD
jgi:esterase/lipase superfamily enzyme